MEYYYEENYPDCYGEEDNYNKQPACLTCVWKTSCNTVIEKLKQQGDNYELNFTEQ